MIVPYCKMAKIKFSIVLLGLFLLAACSPSFNEELDPISEPEIITPETALQSYLNNSDTTFKWEIHTENIIGETKVFELLLTSQTWRGHVWKHQLTILVPKTINYNGALMYITNGNLNNGIPIWVDNNSGETLAFTAVAEKNKAIIAILHQTPMQPLYGGLVEDQLISYTLHQFKKDKDYTWPLLFPMVKGAAKAMDAIHDFSKKNLGKSIQDFTLAGASKRGWTTWLTGANDKRVKAIAPMVIDMLNMPVSMDYHIEAWGAYSDQIGDYTALGIPQTINSPEGNTLTTMIDPYSYRDKLTMPKLIFIGTNDPYWPVDAIKNYINDIPGKNFIHYIANAGHALNGGEQALRALSAFWGNTLRNDRYTELAYQIISNQNGAILTVQSNSDELLNIYSWSANSTDRDFRDDVFISEKISTTTKDEIKYEVNFPNLGFKAFYIDMEFSDPNGGKYTKSTRMYVMDNDEVL